jgi:hypothetical protein
MFHVKHAKNDVSRETWELGSLGDPGLWDGKFMLHVKHEI